MEQLKIRFGFTDKQCKDINDNAVKVFTDAVQKLAKEIVPVIADNIANTIITSMNNENGRQPEHVIVDDTILEDDSPSRLATKFMSDNFEKMQIELKGRNEAYQNYVSYVSYIDLYTEYLEENPVYVPKKFRDDGRHFMSQEEKDTFSELGVIKLRTELNLKKIRRDTFRSRIMNGDELVNKFFHEKISDPGVRDEVFKRWKTATKKDEEKIDESQIKKIETTRKQHQTDKNSLTKNEKQKQATNVQRKQTNVDDELDARDRENIEILSEQLTESSTSRQNDKPDSNSKNEWRTQRQPKKKKQPQLASLTYLTTNLNQMK